MAQYLFGNEKDKENGSKRAGGKQIYLNKPARRLPPWLLPLGLTALLVLLIFVLLPALLRTESDSSKASEEAGMEADARLEQQAAHKHIQAGEWVMAAVGELPIYDGADRNAVRISGALFGEKMEVLGLAGDSRLKIRLEGLGEGYVSRSGVSTDLGTIRKSGLKGRALVLSPLKRIMSHGIAGSLLMEAPMGSLLYADAQVEKVLRLRLPDGKEGWMNTDGIQLLAPGEAIPVPAKATELFVSSAMNFYGSRIIPGGLSKNGADMAGVIFISARVNGLDLPRTLEAQSRVGQEVDIIRDVSTNLARPSLFRAGDVLFFHSGEEADKITSAAMIIDKSRALTALNNSSEIRIVDLDDQPELLSRLSSARRYFP